MARKGILLYSGGLDSLLAGKVLLEQGIEIASVQFISPFKPLDDDPSLSAAARHARNIGLPLRFVRCGREYMDMVKNPLHGYGKNMNPCIDCKIHFLREAKKMMEAQGASFVATGEVVGQRPMSQMRHMLNHIEKESGLEGNLLRPLSAKLMKETNAEKSGIVDRTSLLAINGRSRGAQMELAARYGIAEYGAPAGGCLLTDAPIARRVKDLFRFVPGFSMTDVYLLAVGRHFRLRENLKIIVGRSEVENRELEKYRHEADCFAVPEFKGPALYARGGFTGNDLETLAGMCARYGKPEPENNTLLCTLADGTEIKCPCLEKIDDDVLDKLRI
ncbi:MAG: hypothetical protein EPN93_08425 [Spirochaetes bacterium]|nr:MAG: hypothetical protein EPN93_08425 [Spirochaetota bacterium]